MRRATWLTVSFGILSIVGCDGGDAGGGASAPEEDAASVVSSNLPTALLCGQTFAAEVVVKNEGLSHWTRDAGYKLGAVDDADPFYNLDTRVWLEEGEIVPPGASHTFTIPMRAPPLAGTYVTDWQMVHEFVAWFGEKATSTVEVTCDFPHRSGLVRLTGNALEDDLGTFNALGTTMFWAAWGYKYDRPKLEANLAFLQAHGFDYIRALGVVGDYENADYWDGREIDWHWEDYDQVIAGLTDLAFDVYGIRVQWTLIGDGQVNIPEEADRYALVDRFLAMSEGREEKIILFEIANEAWQNGFEGSDGIAQLRALSSYMKDRTEILVAASAPLGETCEEFEAVYAGGVADLSTIHFDRNVSLVDGAWRPVRQPWGINDCNLPPSSNNEPIGPGSSVASETDPVKLVSAAIVTYISTLPMYVYHTRAGVRGDFEIYDMEGADAFVHLKTLLPPDLPNWSRRNGHWVDAPFVPYAGENGTLYPNEMWPDLDDPESGAVRTYGSVKGEEFLVFPMGILGSLTLEPRQYAMDVDVIDPMTGQTVEQFSLTAGQPFVLTGYDALLLKGRFK